MSFGWKELSSKAAHSFNTRTIGISPCGKVSARVFTTGGRFAYRDSEFQRLRFVSSRRLWLGPRSSGTLLVGLVGLVISSLYQLVTVLNENYFFRILENLTWRRKGRRQLSKCFQLNEYILQKMFDHPTNPQEEREKRGE